MIFTKLLGRLRRRRGTAHGVEAWQRYRQSLALTGIYLALIVLAHGGAMVAFEGLPPGDGLWLTLTTLTTVGYGDVSATSSAGRIATVLLLYVGGIFVVGKMAGDYFDYRNLRGEAMRKGQWNWSEMENHIVIVGTTTDDVTHLKHLSIELRTNEATRDQGVALLTPGWPDGLPADLQPYELRFVSGPGNDPVSLNNAGVASASVVIVLSASEFDSQTDSMTFDVLHRIRECNGTATIVAECVNEANRRRLLNAGATHVLRPVHGYPEMLVGAFVHPGSTEILENLFTAHGEYIERVEGDFDAEWKTIVVSYLDQDMGIPIAYRDRENHRIVAAPRARDAVRAEAIYVIVSDQWA